MDNLNMRLYCLITIDSTTFHLKFISYCFLEFWIRADNAVWPNLGWHK